MWEDGFCRTRAAECMEGMDVEDPVRKAFSKMSIQLYNYGEGWVLGRCCLLQTRTNNITELPSRSTSLSNLVKKSVLDRVFR